MTPAEDPAEAVRHAGRDTLSLLLLEARNELLARLALAPAPAALRLAARAGWFQEWWVARHLQRARGEATDAHAPRLRASDPRADHWTRSTPEAEGADTEAIDAQALHGWLAATLETTLDLLAGAEDNDTGLYVFRLSLQHEERISEALADALTAFAPPPRPAREPVGMPAQRWRLGRERSAPGGRESSVGYVPWGERWAHEVEIPEFEIDAQCVSWAQFAEFADDGGYDRRDCWSDEGWDWLQRDGRRAPRGVEQLVGGSVLVQRGAVLVQAPLTQACTSVTRHEAQAWCRWAGRRLPTEPEWELAAHAGVRRGFAWGDALEWVAGRARCWPDAGAPAPGTLDVFDPDRPGGVLRGCTRGTPARWRHPKARRFAAPVDDTMVSGFRSCALL